MTTHQQLTGTPFHDYLQGGPGDERIEGLGGNDVLDGGGGGADIFVIRRGDGRDTVIGAMADDVIEFGSDIRVSDVVVTSENGDLVLAIAGTSGSVRVAGYFHMHPDHRLGAVRFADGAAWDAAAIERKVHGGMDSLNGTPGGDMLDGGAGDDALHGGDGDDILYGDGGNDFLIGGTGNDTFHFGRGDGRDAILPSYEYQSADRLQFGHGITMADVRVTRQDNHLVLSLEGSNDSVRVIDYFAVAPTERLAQVRFADGSYWDGAAIDRKLMPAPDYLDGGMDNDVLDGGPGDDMLRGAAGDDVLYGDAGNDHLDGGPGSDTFLCGRGDGRDIVIGAEAGDSLRLGTGILMSDVAVTANGGDLVLTIAGTGDSVRVAGYFHNPPEYRLGAIRFADGSAWSSADIERQVHESHDWLMGTMDDDALSGGPGNDLLHGASGSDVLHGGSGDDRLSGGPGADVFLYGYGEGHDAIEDATAGDTIRFGSGISLADVQVAREGGDLLLHVADGMGSLRLHGYFNLWPQDRPSQIRFADGASLDAAAIERRLAATADNLHGTPESDTLDGGPGDDFLHGQDGDDVLYGGAGNDLLDGGTGSDTFHFGRGDGNDVVYRVPDNGGTDVLALGRGIGLSDLDLRMAGTDLVVALRGSVDTIRMTGYPADPQAMPGFAIRFADGTTLDGAAISRLMSSSDDAVMGTEGNDLLVGGGGNDFLDGRDGDDILQGGPGSDVLLGAAGKDVYLFGAGDGADRIVGDCSGDVLQFGPGIAMEDVRVARVEGDLVLSIRGSGDSVRVEGYFHAPADARLREVRFADGGVWDGEMLRRKTEPTVDYLYGSEAGDMLDGGQGDDVLMGMGGSDLLIGDDGNDLLDGGPGADRMAGGRGDDDYRVDDAADTVVEHAGEGSDRISVPFGYVLPAHVEDLVLVGPDAIDGSGNALPNTLSGNDADNRLLGLDGNDTLDGRDGHDSLEGGNGNDKLEGGNGNDVLDGGPGDDRMAGGNGNDKYVLDSPGDSIDERAGEGIDEVSSTLIRTVLATNVENLVLVGAAAAEGIGNELANTIRGNAAANLLDGGSGADTMAGGKGDDHYMVDHAGDLVIEEADEGTDSVTSLVSLVLPDHVENLTLAGSATLTARGNDLSNVLTGNIAANSLDGGAGNDTLDGREGADSMSGGAGNDRYVVDNTADVTIEAAGAGSDAVFSSVTRTLGANLEYLVLEGTAAIDGTGNSAANLIRGNAAANLINGGGGIDVLEGGGGNDTLNDTAGGNHFHGGDGADSITGGSGRDLYIGGAGNDLIRTGTGADVICFNAGDGSDTVIAGSGTDNTISLGGGIRYQDLAFRKSGNSLILETGGSDSIVLQSWYSGTSYQSVATLQVIVAAMPGYQPGGGVLVDNKVETFDFMKLVSLFNQARAANSSLVRWSLGDGLSAAILQGSDTHAFGGDLAYHYGMQDTLAGVSFEAAQSVLADAAYGVQWQEVHPLSSLQAGSFWLV